MRSGYKYGKMYFPLYILPFLGEEVSGKWLRLNEEIYCKLFLDSQTCFLYVPLYCYSLPPQNCVLLLGFFLFSEKTPKWALLILWFICVIIFNNNICNRALFWVFFGYFFVLLTKIGVCSRQFCWR